MDSQKVPLYNHLQAGQCAYHLDGGSLGQDKQLQLLDDGGVDSPPPPILEACTTGCFANHQLWSPR